MAIHQSGEDYLEAILTLQQKNGQVRVVSANIGKYCALPDEL